MMRGTYAVGVLSRPLDPQALQHALHEPDEYRQEEREAEAAHRLRPPGPRAQLVYHALLDHQGLESLFQLSRDRQLAGSDLAVQLGDGGLDAPRRFVLPPLLLILYALKPVATEPEGDAGEDDR